MGLVAVDEQKCTQCGLCARACPAEMVKVSRRSEGAERGIT